MTLQDSVLNILKSSRGAPITLLGIARQLGHKHGTAAISARIRDLRKEKYGGHNIHRNQIGTVHYYELVGQDNLVHKLIQMIKDGLVTPPRLAVTSAEFDDLIFRYGKNDSAQKNTLYNVTLIVIDDDKEREEFNFNNGWDGCQ